MDFQEFDNVKSEKAKAVLRYWRADRKLRTLMRIVEALSALFFLVYYFADITLAVDLMGNFLRDLFRVLARPFSAFVFSNGIIVVILALSGVGKDRDGGDDDNYGNAAFRRVCEEYEARQKTSTGESRFMVTENSMEEPRLEKPVFPSSSREEVQAVAATITVVDGEINKKTVVARVVVTDGDSQRRISPSCSNSDDDDDDDKDNCAPLEGPVNGVKAKGAFGRSNSAVISTQRPRIELRRWATENGHLTVYVGDDEHSASFSPSVDDLSVEEFNLRVERYIATKKLLLREEMMADWSADTVKNRVTLISEQ